jgi:hypothetical protein
VPELLVNYATLPFFLIGFFVAIKSIDFKNQIHTSFLFVSFLATCYFLYEINMITRVHDYYLFPFLPLLFGIILVSLKFVFNSKKRWLNYLLFFTILCCPITAYLRCNTRWNLYDPGTTKEYVIYKNNIQSKLPFNAKVIVDNEKSNCINLYYLNRKGWGFAKGTLTEVLLQNRIKLGATHISFDYEIDKNHFFNNYIDTLIIDLKPLKIYKLKQL